VFLAEPPVFVVADGLGGHKAGEVAAGIAVDTVSEKAPTGLDAEALAQAVRDANDAIRMSVAEGTGPSGMGTTLTAAMVIGERIVLAQVGDSRAYLLAGRSLRRLTRDHSLVGEMVRKGTLTESEARLHPNRSVITRALGSRPEVQVDTYEVDADEGDRLLLCSDGLHGMILDDEIEAVLNSAADAEDAVRMLVAAANDAGGMDNVTAVVVEIGEGRSDTGRRRGIWPVLAWIAAAVLVVAGTVVGLRTYADGKAYLVEEAGVVVVYRGLPGEFAGLRMSWLEQRTEVTVASLPRVTGDRLAEGIAVDGVSEAMDLVAQYRTLLSDEETSAGGS
jgi:protein phosphatase